MMLHPRQCQGAGCLALKPSGLVAPYAAERLVTPRRLPCEVQQWSSHMNGRQQQELALSAPTTGVTGLLLLICC